MNTYLVTLKLTYFDGMSTGDEVLSTSFYTAKDEKEAESKAVAEAKSLKGATWKQPKIVRTLLLKT